MSHRDAVPPRDRIAARLGDLPADGSFSAGATAPVDDLQVEVQGVGRLLLPVSDREAGQLSRIARPARYGQGTRTMLDPRVRDTGEIPLSRIRIDRRRWNRTLLPVLELLRGELGLPPGCELRAELHSMLVYARGQFFVPHQDSEKADDMVGTLVVTLPSAFRGGTLEVEHRGETVVHRSSRGSLSFAAFYSDCRHQIRPVTSGHRIVLTYNLLLKGSTDIGEVPGEITAEIVAGIAQHFETPPDPPKRLVYLLDHEYTPAALSWSRLKGRDATRAAALRSAAALAGCDALLALAEIQETWSAFEPDDGYRGFGRRRWDEWDEEPADEPDGPDEGDYELEELLERTTFLECWVAEAGSEGISLGIADDEVCATTPTGDLQPQRSEYEGYMGNWGNTLDRWYRRGAVVLFPRRLSFEVRAEASPAWALDALSKRLRAGDVEAAREMAAALPPFWRSTVFGIDPGRAFVGKALRVASGLGEPETAAMLLEPLGLAGLQPGHGPLLAALVERYGEPWWEGLLQRWWSRSWSAEARLKWLESLPRLCGALEGSAAAARLLVRASWAWLEAEIDGRLRIATPSRRDAALGDLGRSVGAVLEGSAAAGAADTADRVLGTLLRNDDLVVCCLAVLRAGGGSPSLSAVALHCADRLQARLARPRRREEDWSLELPNGCDCELCRALRAFLAEPAQRNLEWPLAKDRRQHLHQRIDSVELPVEHTTRRTGRPYTLVLSKTRALFELESRARRRDESDLTWLRTAWPAR